MSDNNNLDKQKQGWHKAPDPLQIEDAELMSQLRAQWGWRTFLTIFLFIISATWIYVDLEINIGEIISNSSKNMLDIFVRMLPPDFSDFRQLCFSMLETIEIAILGTLLAIFLSIPMAVLSARNIAPNQLVYFVSRMVTIFFRALPEFIMAMILVIAVGFGAVPGVLALGFHTMGFLAKFYAEAIEHIDENPLQALETMGASKWQIFSFGIVPQILPSFMGNNFYILDRNIRMATMLGIVGAGGIGYELQSSFRMFEYERVSAIILLIFVTIFAIDKISSYIRQKLI